MKEQNVLRFLIPLSLAALLGILVLQIVQLRDVYAQKEVAFDQNVMNSLQRTARTLEAREVRSRMQHLMAGNSVFTGVFVGPQGTKTTFVDSGHSRERRIPLPLVDSVRVAGDSIIVRSQAMPPFRHPGDDARPGHGVTIQRFGPLPKHTVTTEFDGKNSQLRSQFEFEEQFFNGTSVTTLRTQELMSQAINVIIEASGRPIEHVITAPLVDSLLHESLSEAGIGLSCEFGVDSGDSVHMVSSKQYYDDLRTTPLKAPLFQSDFGEPTNRLAVFFPNRNIFLLGQMAPSLVATVCLMLIIIFSFFYTVRTIYRQKRLSILLTDFINNMTHEFKTPISTITVATETLGLPEVAHEEGRANHYLSIIRDEIGRMRAHVDRILQVAVLDEGEGELKVSPLDVHEVLRDVAARFAVRIEHRGGSLRLDTGAARHVISGNDFHFTNIVQNLLDNAEKYSPGPPAIEVTTSSDERTISISVSDRGIGIAPEDQKHVFDKYYRVSTGNIHNVKGFGLGLSYVKMMVEAHRGSLRLESEPGRGTTITIQFPLEA